MYTTLGDQLLYYFLDTSVGALAAGSSGSAHEIEARELRVLNNMDNVCLSVGLRKR